MTTVRGLVFSMTCAYLVTGPVTITALDRPTVLSILTPIQAQEISGQVSFWAGTDGVDSLASLRFQVDGQNYGQAFMSAPYRLTWDSRKATDGPHTVQAIGQDKFGNTLLSQPVTFFVNNFAPQPIASPAPEPTPTPIPPPAPMPAATATTAGPENETSRPLQTTATTAPSASVVASAPLAQRAAVSCKQPDPFKSEGGIGMCVGGEWVLLWKPRKKN